MLPEDDLGLIPQLDKDSIFQGFFHRLSRIKGATTNWGLIL